MNKLTDIFSTDIVRLINIKLFEKEKFDMVIKEMKDDEEGHFDSMAFCVEYDFTNEGGFYKAIVENFKKKGRGIKRKHIMDEMNYLFYQDRIM